MIPPSIFDGVANAVTIGFGPRVHGVGDFPFVARPYVRLGSSGALEGPVDTERDQLGPMDAGIRCVYPGGQQEDVRFKSRNELLALYNDAKGAFESGKGYVDFRGKSIAVDQSFVRALDEQASRLAPQRAVRSKAPEHGKRYLLIYTNENEVEYRVPGEKELLNFEVELPKSVQNDQLKNHQLVGLEWLQRNFRLERNGCLLADDMGLGKTLQVLSFLAWAIERGEIARGSDNPDAAPWDPILIVTPVTLLENETWLDDMRTFFVGQGSIFQPWLVLHGAKLRDFKRRDLTGRETELGQPLLDLEKLRQYRVILSNYETVVNYQHSFAKMKERLSIVVTDEAQEYKTPNTKVSHALKSLSPRFRIACTGTPVETRLLDVWNIFDFLQPGQLLGSAKEFTKGTKNLANP